jgi:hypothetical protein
MFGIFVRYRCEDSVSSARRLHDQLSAHFDAAEVIMDVDDVPRRRISRRTSVHESVRRSFEATLAKIQD